MLSREENDLLTRVGPGTPMGELMRRYWIPALLSEEIAEADGAPARVRILGEHLVAFRDSDGRVGLLEEYCPHRRASLVYGRNEESGLRCIYHGWKMDVEGHVLEIPCEPAGTAFTNKVKHRAYPTREAGGGADDVPKQHGQTQYSRLVEDRYPQRSNPAGKPPDRGS